MNTMTLSDLSQMFQLRRDTVRVRQDLNNATLELSTGKHADLGKAMSGNFGPLVAIDQQLSRLDAFEMNVTEGKLFTDAAQMSLDRMRILGAEYGTRLLGLNPNDVIMHKTVFANEAIEAFGASVAALNTTVAGRAVFAGTATEGFSVAPADFMLDEIRAAVAGLTTAQDVIDRVTDWFAPGNEFDTVGYVGSTNDLSGYQVAEGQKVMQSVRADNTAMREQLRGFALGALLEGSDITDGAELAELADASRTGLMSNQIKLIAVQASVGAAQDRIEDAGTRNGAERTVLAMARSRIVAVDPYETATKLQDFEAQLQTIYTITARLSGLSLTNFLR